MEIRLEDPQADKTSLATYAKPNLTNACETYIGYCKWMKVELRLLLINTSDNHKGNISYHPKVIEENHF